MKNIISNIITIIKKEKYIIDNALNDIDIIQILFNKTIMLIRGCTKKIFFKKSEGLLFIGCNVQIFHSRKIQCGRNFTIGDYSYINALCKDGVTIGNNVSFGRNCIVQCYGVLSDLGHQLVIGNNVGFNSFCLLAVRGSIIIGNDVIIGHGVRIIAENHIYNNPDIPIRKQSVIKEDIRIEDDVWVGANVVILCGVKIGKGSIVAGGAVVNKDVPPYSVVGGVPAKIIKYRGKINV